MGLAQKRILKDFQDNAFPEWKNKLAAAIGFDLPIEIRWETMVDDNYEDKDYYFEWYAKVYFQPLIETFQSICKDSTGKEALQAALKKVIVESDNNFSSYRGTTFEGGVFHVKHSFCSNVDDIGERVEGWTKLLESKI
jgi:hypothetical protein